MANNMESEFGKYLPEVFREDPATLDFLRAFEAILLGNIDLPAGAQGQAPQGLEQTIDDLARFFTPGMSPDNGAPDGFLLWLSQWMALSIRMDVDLATRRDFIATMAKRYRIRGTKESMRDLLHVFTKKDVRDISISDQVTGEPHFFQVMLDLENVKTGDSKEEFDRVMEIAHAVICMEKPAHTRYQLIPAITTMRIGKGQPSEPGATTYNIRVERNTRLGAARWKK